MERMSLEEYRKSLTATKEKKKYTYHEHQAQCEVFDWARVNLYKYPKLRWLYSSQDGTYMDWPKAKRAAAAGMKSGVPDLFLPVKNKTYAGLFIEMKSKNGSAKKNQKEYINYLNSEGYLAVVCKGRDKAIEAIEKYLNS